MMIDFFFQIIDNNLIIASFLFLEEPYNSYLSWICILKKKLKQNLNLLPPWSLHVKNYPTLSSHPPTPLPIARV